LTKFPGLFDCLRLPVHILRLDNDSCGLPLLYIAHIISGPTTFIYNDTISLDAEIRCERSRTTSKALKRPTFSKPMCIHLHPLAEERDGDVWKIAGKPPEEFVNSCF
jgi:hypothetical protein